MKSDMLSMLLLNCVEAMLDVTVAVKAETSTTPKIIQKTAMIRPAMVAGVLSPYPTVVMVTAANQSAEPMPVMPPWKCPVPWWRSANQSRRLIASMAAKMPTRYLAMVQLKKSFMTLFHAASQPTWPRAMQRLEVRKGCVKSTSFSASGVTSISPAAASIFPSATCWMRFS